MDAQEKTFETNTALEKCTGLLNKKIVGDYNFPVVTDFFFSIQDHTKNDSSKISQNLYMLSLYNSLKYIDKEINRLYSIVKNYYEFVKLNGGKADTELHTEIFHLKMYIINMIKRFIDDLISISYMALVPSETEVYFKEIGMIIANKDSNYNDIRQKTNYDTFEFFFKAINDYTNSFKHSILNYETSILKPTCENGYINATSLKLNEKTNKVVYLSSYFKQIVQGFNDFLEVSWGLKKSNDVKHRYY